MKKPFTRSAITAGTVIFGGLVLSGINCEIHAQTNPPPNIIIFFADDKGYADLGISGADPDVRTPNLDQLARDGVLFTRGYTTAPQCVPSRAGLISGRYQNAFGVETNDDGPLPYAEYTIAERLHDAGYITGMVGKWHLEGSNPETSTDYLPHAHGFDEYFCGTMQTYQASHDLNGNPLVNPPQKVTDQRYRVDIQTLAALSFLDRRKTDSRPFFLYVAYYAPHSPMEDPPQYMERMTHVKEYQRRMGLASVLAIDDGVGLIRKRLQDMGITGNTLIFYMSDNGAPVRSGAYIGSRNSPMTGEKGMVTDGGQHVSFLAAWPGRIPPGQIFNETVWTLDASATAVSVAGAPIDEKIEGKNLIPWLTGEKQGQVHDTLCWRWRSQAAILSGNWKFIRLGNERRYLFDMTEVGKETVANNKINQFPEIATELEQQLLTKSLSWKVPGLRDEMEAADKRNFDQHVDCTLPPLLYGDGTTGKYEPWDPTRPITPLYNPRPFSIISNNSKGTVTTDTIQSGDFTLGINDYGGGSISMVSLPGIGNIMGPQALSYGRMGQSSIRSKSHGNVYNPTQAGFHETIGTECPVKKIPGKMTVEPRGCVLWRADNNYDYTRWENIGSDGYDEFAKHGGTPGASDEDGLNEEELEVVINGTTYAKQEAEVYSEFDYYGTYENYRGKSGIAIPAIRHYFEYRFIRPPGHCIDQFRQGTPMWDENAIVEDISVEYPEGVFRGTDKDMNTMTTSWSIRNDLALWKPMVRHIQKSDGTWEITSRESAQSENITDYKRLFIVAESEDINSGRAIGFYQPESDINKYPVMGIRESDGSIAYKDDRVTSSFWRDEPFRTSSMSWMGFRNISKGLINRDRLPEGIYEAYRQEFYIFYGTPQQIKNAIASLDKGVDYKPSHDATLSAITWPDMPPGMKGWEGDTIPSFNPETNSYTITLPYGTSAVPALVAFPSNLGAKITAFRATSLAGTPAENTTRFIVTAEDDSTENEYSVTFIIEKPRELVQDYQGSPFISEVIMRFYNRVGMLEIAHAGNVPLDMSGYMLVRSTTTDPVQAIINAIPEIPSEENFRHRYNAYIPGYKYSDDTITWINNPGKLYPDPDVYPTINPGETFNMIACPGRHSRITPGLEAVSQKIWTTYDDLNTSYVDTSLDISLWVTPPNLKYNAEALFIFKILNDSILDGTKEVGDPGDFELIETFGDVNAGSPWQIAGVEITNTFAGRVRLKSEYSHGVATLGEGNGTNEDDSRWIVESQSDIGSFDNFITDFGKHSLNIDPVTSHISTITSNIYLVSDGYKELQTIQGDLTGISVNQFYQNISRADTGQVLTLISGIYGSSKTLNEDVAGNDTLMVLSADGKNTTRYLLIDETLNNDAVLTAREGSGYSVEITGNTGIISGMEFGSTLRSILENLIKPDLATMNIIDADNNLVPLLTLNTSSKYVGGNWIYSYSYAGTKVGNNFFLEVVAQNRTTVITYQLEPSSLSDQAIAISSVYQVNQDSLIIAGIPYSTPVNLLFNNIEIPKGASLQLMDNKGYIRETGIVWFDDKLVVTSEDQTNTVTYYLDFLTETEPDRPIEEPTWSESSLQPNEHLIIYPNPTNDRIFLKGLSHGAILTLSDLWGRIILVKPAMELEQGIPLRDQPAGIYLIKIQNKDHSVHHAKVVKQ